MSDDDHKVIPLRITPPTRAASRPGSGMIVRPQFSKAVRPAMGVTVHDDPSASRLVTPTEILPPGTSAPPFVNQWPKPAAPEARRLHVPTAAYLEGVPVFQWATVTIQPSDDSPVNNAALVNPGSQMVEVEEIRFNLRSSAQYVNLGGVGVRIDLGPYPVTKDFVPLFNLDDAENLFEGESQPVVNPIIAGTPDFASCGAFRWTPAHRLYLPPGGGFNVQFNHLALVGAEIVADVSYAGRVLAESEREREAVIPYAASWVANGVNVYGFDFTAGNYRLQTPVTESSTEQDLVIKAAEPVRVKKITGRFLFLNTFAGELSSFSDEARQQVDEMIYVRLRTSRGYRITKGFVPFRLLFARDTRGLDTDFVLEPGDYVIADIQYTAGNLSGTIADEPNSSPLNVTVRPTIGLIGDRSVPL